MFCNKIKELPNIGKCYEALTQGTNELDEKSLQVKVCRMRC